MLKQELVNKIKINFSKQDSKLPVIFGVLGESRRFLIFKLLARHKDICVSDIARILGITVSAASQQLRIMEMTEIVKKTRQGQMTCYELNKKNPLVKKLVKFIYGK